MEFKDIVVDNDAIVNTEPKELPEEAHNIPQGVKPHLNPNPGYGEDGKTVPAIKTDLVEGERGTPIDVVTEPQTAFKTVQEVYNFLNGLKIKGKNLEEYIDSQGGVTEEELTTVLAEYTKKSEVVEQLVDKDVKVKTMEQTQPNWEVDIKSILNPLVFKDTTNLYAKMCLYGNELSIVISGKFVAQAEENTYKGIIASQNITIPEEIASKIYRADGTTLKQNVSVASGFNSVITEFTYVRQNPTVGNGNVIISSSYANNISIVAYGFGATTEDSECYIDLRVQLLIV